MANEAQRIMAAGGRWQAGMRFTRHGSGTQALGDQQGMYTASDHPRGPLPSWLPDLTDGPTCRALWDQLRGRVGYLYLHQMPGYTQFSISIGDELHQTMGGPEPEGWPLRLSGWPCETMSDPPTSTMDELGQAGVASWLAVNPKFVADIRAIGGVK